MVKWTPESVERNERSLCVRVVALAKTAISKPYFTFSFHVSGSRLPCRVLLNLDIYSKTDSYPIR
nr:MAG TPA: hypothetical protein [Microviridae sp.]